MNINKSQEILINEFLINLGIHLDPGDTHIKEQMMEVWKKGINEIIQTSSGRINEIPMFNPEKTVYFIGDSNKISKGKIIGFTAESIVLDENQNAKKIGNGKFQIKKTNSNELPTMVSIQKVFSTMNDAIKHICDGDDIYTELKNEVQFKETSLHKENQYNPIDTFDEYQKIAMSTKDYGAGLPVFYPTIKLNGEAGEVAEKVGKSWRDKNGQFSKEYIEQIKFEMGDVMWYICALADDLGLNLVDIANSNVQKILDRRKRNVVSGNGDNR